MRASVRAVLVVAAIVGGCNDDDNSASTVTPAAVVASDAKVVKALPPIRTLTPQEVQQMENDLAAKRAANAKINFKD